MEFSTEPEFFFFNGKENQNKIERMQTGVCPQVNTQIIIHDTLITKT